jgi:hypothetical protein
MWNDARRERPRVHAERNCRAAIFAANQKRPPEWPPDNDSGCVSVDVNICAAHLAIDNSAMKLPEPPPPNPRFSRAPKSALVIMLVILAAMALVSIYANVQRWRRDKIETVIVTPVALPSATP